MAAQCLVTGGAGFIGCAISGELVRCFDRVVVVDNLHPQIHRGLVRPVRLDTVAELVVADITRSETWLDLLASCTPNVIIHLAAETGTGQSLTEASRHAEVNVVGTTQMLDALVRRGALPERIVLSSSRAVYGEGAWKNERTGEISYPGQRSRAQLDRKQWDFAGLTCLPFEALSTQPHPTSIYGSTKLAQEHILQAWALAFGVEIGILRLQNVYGPGQSMSNPYTGIVSLFARMAREGRSIPVYEDGNMLRDFVFIDDVADAVCRVARTVLPSSLPYDVGSGSSLSIYNIAQTIARIYDAPAPHVSGAFRNGDVRHAACRISRTTAELGWAPTWDFENGVRQLCRWIDSTPSEEFSRSARPTS